jgi:hypothetical protein
MVYHAKAVFLHPGMQEGLRGTRRLAGETNPAPGRLPELVVPLTTK